MWLSFFYIYIYPCLVARQYIFFLNMGFVVFFNNECNHCRYKEIIRHFIILKIKASKSQTKKCKHKCARLIFLIRPFLVCFQYY